MKFTWETEAHRPHPNVWTQSITELSSGCESSALLFYTPKSNLHFYSNEGSLHCFTTFSIPQVQSFHREWAQSLIYISAVNCDYKYKTHWGLGGVSFPSLSCFDRRIFSYLCFLEGSLLRFVFLWVTSNSISVQHKSFGKAEDLQPQLPRRTSSLPGEAVLIPRDSIFSYGTRSPWSNNILWPVTYGRGGSRDRVGLQVGVSSNYYATLKELMLYSADRHQRAAKFPSPSLPKDGRKEREKKSEQDC